MKLVYISSPLKGDKEENIFKAVLYSKWASKFEGIVPLAPHTIFTQYLDDEDEKDRKKGLELAHSLLLCCDEVWIMGNNISPGMKEEMKIAAENDIRLKFFSDSEVFEKGAMT